MKVGVDEIEENNEGEIGQLVTSGMPDGHENHQGQSSARSNGDKLNYLQRELQRCFCSKSRWADGMLPSAKIGPRSLE